MKQFVLAGNPNSGKTTLFNSLTGSTAHVGNWPGVTVDKREGLYKKLEEEISIVDLPGIYSLSPYTPEEIITRNYIVDEAVDCVINIVDATNIERNLYLTTQLLEIDVPVIIALNMMDEVQKQGKTINAKELEKRIGVPVVEISALRQKNLDVLMKRAYKASKFKRFGSTVLEETDLRLLIESIKNLLVLKRVKNPLFHAIKLIENDEVEITNHKELQFNIDVFKNTYHNEVFEDDLEAIIADGRYRYITKHFSSTVEVNVDNELENRNIKIDKVLTNRYAGIPIFLFILLTIFHLTFSEDLLFLSTIFSWFNIDFSPISFSGTIFEGVLANGGINSPGVMLFNLVDVITSSIINWVATTLVSLGAQKWVLGLVCDGVLSGIASVLSFLPQILLLFLFFSILEDSGYMARIAFILDRILNKFGLSGRAFLPMIMGFGCSVPAMINTRTLADEKEKIATIRVIPFFSCGAKLPILTVVAAALVQKFGFANADIITYSMYFLGMTIAFLSVIIMRKTELKGTNPPFIMELPSYRLPQFKSTVMLLWDKAKHFIKKAFTIILASTIVIWFISHFTWKFEFVEDMYINQSILASIGKILQPIFTPLGFGVQLSNEGWVFIVGAITGLIAKENVIATFGTLAVSLLAAAGKEFSGGEVDAVLEMINATGITVPALLSFIAFNMLTIPCFATVATAKAELGWKKFILTILFWILTSFVVSTLIYLIGLLIMFII